MLPLFLLSVALNPYRNITVAVGAVSTNKNPFWSQKIPGINFCDNENYLINYEYNHNERKTIIPFPNVINEKDNFESTYVLCNHIIKQRFINDFEKIAIDGSFLRFYIGQTVIRTNFFTTNNNEKEIYTHYQINIDNSEDTPSPRAEVIPSKEMKMIERREIEFSFSVKFCRIEADEKVQSIEKVRNDQCNKLIFLSTLLFLISVLVSIIFYYKKRDSHTIPFNEVWRIPPDLTNSFLFSILGMYIINISIYLLLLKRDCDPYGAYVEKIIYPSLVVPITIYTLIAKTLGLKAEMPNWMAPSSVYFIIFVLIPHLFTLLFNIFGSFRGFSLLFIVINDPFFLIMNLIFIDGAGPAANLLNPPISIDSQTGPTSLPKKSVKFISKVFDLIYVGVSVFVLMPLSEHLFEIFFDDKLVNGKIFGTSLALFCAVGSIFALFRALPRTLYITDSWQSGLMGLNFKVALLEVAFVIYISVFQRHVVGIQPILMVFVFTLPYFFSIMSVGCAVFYLVPFCPILATFSQTKAT